MNLRNLRYFVGVAEANSVSAAAERLHRSQPAVSRAIQELESEMGITLFLREGRRMTPTAEAWGLLPMARSVLRGADELDDRARQLASGKVSVLRLGGVAITVESVLPRLIAAYRQKSPTVEVALTVDTAGGLLVALERGELDVIATREISNERLESRRILPMHVLAVMRKGHPLAAGRAVKLEDLLTENLMLGPPSFTSRMLFDAACSGFDMRPRIVLESPQQRALVALAEVGHGVAIVPSVVSLAGHGVAARPIRSGGQLMGSWSSLVWDRRRSTESVMSFVDIATRVLQKGYPGSELGLPPLPPVIPPPP